MPLFRFMLALAALVPLACGSQYAMPVVNENRTAPDGETVPATDTNTEETDGEDQTPTGLEDGSAGGVSDEGNVGDGGSAGVDVGGSESGSEGGGESGSGGEGGSGSGGEGGSGSGSGGEGGNGSGGEGGNGSQGGSGDAGTAVCAKIDAIAGHCPGYGYDCPAYPSEQSECLLTALEVMQNPCAVFADLPLCAGDYPSETGFGSCLVQECFGLNDAAVCLDSLEILCSYP